MNPIVIQTTTASVSLEVQRLTQGQRRRRRRRKGPEQGDPDWKTLAGKAIREARRTEGVRAIHEQFEYLVNTFPVLEKARRELLFFLLLPRRMAWVYGWMLRRFGLRVCSSLLLCRERGRW